MLLNVSLTNCTSEIYVVNETHIYFYERNLSFEHVYLIHISHVTLHRIRNVVQCDTLQREFFFFSHENEIQLNTADMFDMIHVIGH